jgi:hypothetical protein
VLIRFLIACSVYLTGTQLAIPRVAFEKKPP